MADYQFGPATGTVTSVNDAAADTTILAANGQRKGATVYNDSTSILYLLVAAGTASTTNFSIKMGPGDIYELPRWAGNGCYTGIIKGIWSADASGAALITEYV